MYAVVSALPSLAGSPRFSFTERLVHILPLLGDQLVVCSLSGQPPPAYRHLLSVRMAQPMPAPLRHAAHHSPNVFSITGLLRPKEALTSLPEAPAPAQAQAAEAEAVGNVAAEEEAREAACLKQPRIADALRAWSSQAQDMLGGRQPLLSMLRWDARLAFADRRVPLRQSAGKEPSLQRIYMRVFMEDICALQVCAVPPRAVPRVLCCAALCRPMPCCPVPACPVLCCPVSIMSDKF